MGWVWAIMFGHGGSVLARGNWLYLSWAGGFHLNMFSAWERTVVDGSTMPHIILLPHIIFCVA